MELFGLNKATLELYMDMQMPVICVTLLNIYLWFESIPNAMAELTYYADRQFYLDWWNATSVEEFIKKWYKLPYLFFYRHGFVTMAVKYSVDQRIAVILSFAIYALFMELIIVMSTGVLKFYLFKLLMIALVWHVIQLKFTNYNPQLFNAITLFGFLTVIPLLACMYLREYILNARMY